MTTVKTGRPDSAHPEDGARHFAIRPADWVFLASFVALLSAWSMWWIALYPGILSPDSLDQWAQAQAFHFNNWHPYLYAMILGVLKYVNYSPSMMGLLQIVLAALLISAIARYVYVRRVSPVWLFLVVAIYAFHPQFGDYNVTIWKDVLFSILMLAEAFLIYRIASGREDSWQPFVLLGLLAGLSVSVRSNGVVNLVLPAVLLLFTPARRKWVLLLLVSGLVTQLFFGVVLFDALHVEPRILQEDQIRVKMVGAIYRLSKPAPSLTAEQARVFEAMMPPEVWKSAYTPWYSNDLYFDHFMLLPQVRGLTRANIGQSAFYSEWKRAVIGAALRNPGAVLRDKYLQTLYFMLASGDPVVSQRVDVATLQAQNYAHIESVLPSDRFPRLRAFFDRVLAMSSEGALSQVLWAPGWVLVAYLGMLLYAAVKKYRATLLFICFILLNVAFVIAVAPASDYRYLYFATLSVFVTPLLLMAEARGEPVEARVDSGTLPASQSL